MFWCKKCKKRIEKDYVVIVESNNPHLLKQTKLYYHVFHFKHSSKMYELHHELNQIGLANAKVA